MHGKNVECAQVMSSYGRVSRPLPADMVIEDTRIRQIDCAPDGFDGMCALLTNGTVTCWGSLVNPVFYHSMVPPYPMFVVSTPADVIVSAMSIDLSMASSAQTVVLALANGTLVDWILAPVINPANQSAGPIAITTALTSVFFSQPYTSELIAPLSTVSPRASYVCGLSVDQLVMCRFKGRSATVQHQLSPLRGTKYAKLITASAQSLDSGACVCGTFLKGHIAAHCITDNLIDCCPMLCPALPFCGCQV